MIEWTKANVDKARKSAKANPKKKPEAYLCYEDWESAIMKNAGLETPEEMKWNVFTENQFGYKNATERIPLFSEKVVIPGEKRDENWWEA